MAILGETTVANKLTVDGLVTAKQDFAVCRDGTAGELVLFGDNVTTDGKNAAVVLRGRTKSSEPGSIYIRAGDGTTTKVLLLKPDGTFTWNNNAVCYNNMATINLGNTLVFTGTGYNSIKKTTADSSGLEIFSGTVYNDAPSISLYASTGNFNIRSGTNSYSLTGTSAGSLSWGGKEIERVNAKNIAQHNSEYIRYESGVQLCWHTITVNVESTAAQYRVTSWTYPAAFVQEPMVFCNSRHDRFNVGTNSNPIGNSSCQIYYVNDSQSTFTETFIDCLAIGRWK